MLLLLFYLGEQLYALDSSQVVEVIPKVIITKLYQAPVGNKFPTPDYVAGLFNYRGKIIPVIDLSLLIQKNPCHFCLSTRIIIVEYLDQSKTKNYLGLMAEKVTDTLNKLPSEAEKTDYGDIIRDRQQIIQLLRVESLFPSSEELRKITENINY